MHSSHLILNLFLALGAAFLGGMIARALRLPVLLGYLVAGVIIGPNTPGLVADRQNVEQMANLGVAFLMFGLGVEFSLKELVRFGRIAVLGGSLQILSVAGLGTAAGRIIGWSWPAAILLGGAFAISSSIVALKILIGRGEAGSPHARVALAVGVVQDLSLVPMIAILPVLAGRDGGVGLSLAKSLGTAAIALIIVVVLGTRLVPRVLYTVAKTESRELFLLTIVLIAFGTALAAEEAGLSAALGAFLAGLVVSESEFDDQALAEIVPLRDLFATLFFVAVGMLLDPGQILDHPALIAGLIATLVIGKVLLMGASLLLVDVDHRTATLSSILMAQMGEFSFVLAGVGLSLGIIASDQYSLILATAIGSILLVPVLLPTAPVLTRIAARLPAVARREQEREGDLLLYEEQVEQPRVVLLGYGRVGRTIGDVLSRQRIPYAVIDIHPAPIRALRAQGIPAYYGDAAADALLKRAGVAHARTMLITTPDFATAAAAIRHARRLNPSIRVMTRADNAAEVAILREAGIDIIVQPEFEGALEMLRHLLAMEGTDPVLTDKLVRRSRRGYYRPDTLPPEPPEEDASVRSGEESAVS